MALATKTQSQNIFAKLKLKPANKVRSPNREGRVGQWLLTETFRYVSTAAQRTRHGARSPSASTCASIARRTTETWECTSPLCAPPTSTVRTSRYIRGTRADSEQYGNGINCVSSRWAATKVRPSTSSRTEAQQRSRARTTRPNTPAMPPQSTRRNCPDGAPQTLSCTSQSPCSLYGTMLTKVTATPMKS